MLWNKKSRRLFVFTTFCSPARLKQIALFLWKFAMEFSMEIIIIKKDDINILFDTCYLIHVEGGHMLSIGFP